MNYKQLLALRKWVIFSTYGDSKLANKYYKSSNKRILEELGIDLSRRKSFTKREFTKEQIYRRQKRYKNFVDLKQAGLSVVEAYVYTKSRVSNKQRLAIKKQKELTDIKINLLKIRDSKTRAFRKVEWSKWSKHPKDINLRGEFPAFAKDVAQTLNVEKGFDIDSSYGYSVLNYVYVRDKDYDVAQNVFDITQAFMGKEFMYKSDSLMSRGK